MKPGELYGIETAYAALLGRAPTPDELAVAENEGPIATAGRLAASGEHRAAVQSGVLGCHLLFGSDAARTAHPPGTISDDRAAIVGHDHRILLSEGSNDYVAHFCGIAALRDGWLAAWCELIDVSRQRAAKAGARLVQLIVPEKLAVEPEGFPGTLHPTGPRPVERLLSARPDLLYPRERLASSPDPAFLATDTHPSPAGGSELLSEVFHQLGCAPATTPDVEREYLYLGDLGMKLVPPVIEARMFPEAAEGCRVVAENFSEMAAAGGHLGVWRTVENAGAPDARSVVVFGDSIAFPPPRNVTGGFGDRLCRTFARVHFCWSPFSWDSSVVAREQPDVIIQESGERLIPTVPPLEVDLDALAAATLARHRPMDDQPPGRRRWRRR